MTAKPRRMKKKASTASDTKGMSASLQMKLLHALLEFMMRTGMKERDVRAAFRTCLNYFDADSVAADGDSSREGGCVGNGNVSAELIRLWTRDGRYIDRDARPKPLPLSSGRSNLVSLIGMLDPSANPNSTVKSMMAVGLIRKLPGGKYIPTAESVTIDYLHPLAVEHVAKSLIRLIATVCRNTDQTRDAIPLIERYAYVPDLSKAESRAFAEFTRTQGMVYLESVDDWLEQRRARRVPAATNRMARAGVTAGVHLVAYLGDSAQPEKRPSAKPTPKKSPTPAPRAVRA